jgi:hypothetical protein
MHNAMLLRNYKHFSQADGTPFTLKELMEITGIYGTTVECKNILQGTFDINKIDTSEAVKRILKQVQRSESVSDISDSISASDLINGYKRWGEGMTTSPSGIHLGHEKATLKRKDIQDEEAKTLGKDPLYLRVFQIKAKLLEWAMKYRHVCGRWTKVVNAMLEKIPGKPLLNKLRVIHLLESDFNLMIGILWGRRLVHQGEQINAFDDGQGGSRLDRRTQELLLQKHLTYSIWRMARINGASFDNDTKSCFDRIVMTVASLCSQQLGMTVAACELFLETLRKMNYHIKTGAGISDESYCTDEFRTMHGPGQGGRGSPCIWLIISSVLMKCMEDKLDGTLLRNPYKHDNLLLQRITGFVDAVTHWYSSTDKLDTTEDMIDDLTIVAQWWEQLLHASGGKLELTKCFYYLVKWKFDKEGIPSIIPQHKAAKTVQLIDSETHKTVDIECKSNYEAHKTLGVMESPAGDYKAEFERMQKKLRSFAQKIAQAHLTRSDAIVLYRSTYIPSMTYSLSIGTFNTE